MPPLLCPHFIHSSYDASKVKALAKGGKTREALFALALAAERSERYNDVLLFLKTIISIVPGDLSHKERKLLCATYGRLYVALRSAWKSMTYGIYDAKEDDGCLGSEHAIILTDYKRQIREEVLALSQDALKEFGKLIVKASQGQTQEAYISTVVYYKNSGDYCRFMAQVLGDRAAGARAIEFYKKALKLAESEAKLASTHPSLLDVVLNYSVCLKEIARDTTNACLLAKEAFDQAIERLEDVKQDSYKDTTLILQLIRDNLMLWASSSSSISKPTS